MLAIFKFWKSEGNVKLSTSRWIVYENGERNSNINWMIEFTKVKENHWFIKSESKEDIELGKMGWTRGITAFSDRTLMEGIYVNSTDNYCNHDALILGKLEEGEHEYTDTD